MTFTWHSDQSPIGEKTIIEPEDMQEFGTGDWLWDVAKSPFRGIQQAGVEAYETLDWIGESTGLMGDFLPDVPEEFGIARSKTIAGSLVEGIFQFGAGFVPVVGVMGKAGKIAKLGQIGTRLAKISDAKKAAGAVKTATAIKYSAGFAKTAVAGAVTDAVVYDAHEDRLANLLVKFPVLNNPVTRYLEADEDDTTAEGKFKNAIEGLLLGGLTDTLFMGVRAIKHYRRNRKILKTAPAREDPKESIRRDIEENKVQRNMEEDVRKTIDENRVPSHIEEQLADGGPRPNTDATGEEMLEPVKLDDDIPAEEMVDPTQQKDMTKEKAASANADKAVKEAERKYRKIVEDAYGKAASESSDWLTFLHKIDRKFVENFNAAVEQAKTLKGAIARTPKQGSALNLDRFSATDGNDKNLYALMSEGSETFKNDLNEVRQLTHDQIIEKADHANAFIREATGDGISKKDMIELQDQMIAGGKDVPSKLEEIIVKQNILRRYAQQYTQMMNELADKALGPQGTNRDVAKWMMAEKKAEEVLLMVKRNQEKIAQALGAQRIVATDIGPTKNVGAFLGAADDDALVTDMLKEIGSGDVVRGGNIMRTKIQRFKAAQEIAGTGGQLRNLSESASKAQMLTEYWMNSILSGPLTHAVNATSNFLNMLLLPLEKSAGGLLALNAKEMKEGIKMYAYIWEQNLSAMKLASVAFRKEKDLLDPMGGSRLHETGTDRALRSKNKALDYVGQALNLPSRLLLTSDNYFKQINYRAVVKSELTSQSLDVVDASGTKLVDLGREAQAEWIEKEFSKIVQDGQFYSFKTLRERAEHIARESSEYKALKKAKPADKVAHSQFLRKHINEFMKNNWNEEHGALAERALEYSRDVTWTKSLNDPDRGMFVHMAGGFQRVVNDYPLLRLLFPFVRTPTNIIAFFLERSVGAWAKLAGRGYKYSLKRLKNQTDEVDAIMKAGGEPREKLLGQIATGSAMMSIAVVAYQNGIISGGGPMDRSTRQSWEATNWTPYSLELGGKRFSYRRFDPFASFLGIIADMGEALKEAEGEDKNVVEALFGAMTFAASRSVTNKSFLTGMARITNVLANPERYSEPYIRQTAASFGPMSSFMGQLFDPEFQTEIRTVLDSVRVKYGLIGSSTQGTALQPFNQEVAKRYNVLGEPLERQKPYPYMPVVYYTEVKDDFILNELKDLNHGFSPPPHTISELNLDNYVDKNGQSSWSVWAKNHGKVRIQGRTIRQALKHTMKKSAEYRNAPKESVTGGKSPRVEILRRVIRKYRAAALKMTLREFPELDQDYKVIKKVKSLQRAGQAVPEHLLNILNF